MIDAVGLDYLCEKQSLVLLPQKAIFWKQTATLIVADVHLGKVGHFRKSGIAIPRNLEQEDLAILSDLIRKYHPERIIFLGDLFHSEFNSDWEWLAMWGELFSHVSMVLVKGNHDIVDTSCFEKLGFSIADTFSEGPFLFSHEPLSLKELEVAKQYVISGHIHPGVKLRGAGHQSLSLPCFYFGKKQAVLPAFGRFTGKVCISYSDDDEIFGVLKQKVIPL